MEDSLAGGGIRFADKIIVVTGAADGLGRALARGFAAEGGTVIAADINIAGAEETASMIRAAGGSAEAIPVDMGDESSIQALAAAVRARHDAVHVLINNAGIAYGHVSDAMAGLTQSEWLRYLSVNTVGPTLLADALRPALAAAGHAVVINQSSMSSFAPVKAYGVTKAALNAMTYGLAHAYGEDGIRVLAIAPGLMETPANKTQLTPEVWESVLGMQILRQERGRPEDIVALALFLASEAARFITCDVISCDGGNAIRGWRN